MGAGQGRWAAALPRLLANWRNKREFGVEGSVQMLLIKEELVLSEAVSQSTGLWRAPVCGEPCSRVPTAVARAGSLQVLRRQWHEIVSCSFWFPVSIP